MKLFGDQIVKLKKIVLELCTSLSVTDKYITLSGVLKRLLQCLIKAIQA